jgi:L-ribulose-5-phosphate 4-epimerase
VKARGLREEVCRVNREIADTGLAILTWGNASGADRREGLMAIKPSGIDYQRLQPEDLVLLSLDTGEVLEGELRPSSDTPTHLHLYRAFRDVGGIVHTHSHYATAWAQASREIPCFGTTHADHFRGAVPVTRPLSRSEVESEYELHTGKVIVERYSTGRLEPLQRPAVLVAGHAPFVWGRDVAAACENAVVLEAVARMALDALSLDRNLKPIPDYLLAKHFDRKHGPGAYYGQPSP